MNIQRLGLLTNRCGSSPVFRIGGDEFAVILNNEDYAEREELIRQFEESCKRVNADSVNKWKQVHISMGFADYVPLDDNDVSDVFKRADKAMYENKRLRKINNQNTSASS